MPDLLLEFLSEEIPARMQARAAEDLKKDGHRPAGGGRASSMRAPRPLRRRAAWRCRCTACRRASRTSRKRRKARASARPRAPSPDFLKAAGLTSIDEAKVQADKKGDFYVAVIEKAGKPAIEVIGEMMPEVVRSFPWPKSMRWGSGPAHLGAPAAFHRRDLRAGNRRAGHRQVQRRRHRGRQRDARPPLHGARAIKVRRFDDYVAKLEKAKVVLDPARRADMIRADAKNLAFAQGYELVEDEGLLAEVAGLVEWPVTLMGSFDEAFLDIPGEVIRATIRTNQKCFVLRDPQTAKLVNKFILVANIEASDGGKAIVAGNERVIRARLSDAKFFYDTDLKTKLEDRLPKFEQIVFHEKAGHAGRAHRAHRGAGQRTGAAGQGRSEESRARRATVQDRPA